MAEVEAKAYGAIPHWTPGRPKVRPRRLLLQWVTSALALYIAAMIVPGVRIEGFIGAFIAAALIAVLNAVLPPLIAALRLPYMLAVGFLLVLFLDAWMVRVAADLSDHTFEVDRFFWALLVALVAAAVTVVLEVLLGTNDEDVYSLRVTQRIARRSRARAVTDVPGIVYLEIDGLARPVLQRAIRDGHAPEMARWLASGSHRLSEWETDLSSQTGASQAGLLLGSNDDIPAFRWVEKESGRIMTCSAPADCALIEERHSSGHGLLAGRRRQPQQPAVGRRRPGDPHRQPDGGGEEGQPRLPGVPRRRLQRHAHLRALLLRGGAGAGRRGQAAAPGRAAARPPLAQLRVHARGSLRLRARLHRAQHHQRHDDGRARRLRLLRRLRRGGPPLGPRARGHHGGAAQARPAVRAHRARPAVRRAALRDRRALRPRPDPGRDLQAAQRPRPRRSGGAQPARGGRREPRIRRRERHGGVQGGARGDRPQAEGRGQAPGRRPQGGRHGVGQPRAHLPDGRAATDDDGGDRGAAPRPAAGAPRPPARRLAAGALERARRRGAGRGAAPTT